MFGQISSWTSGRQNFYGVGPKDPLKPELGTRALVLESKTRACVSSPRAWDPRAPGRGSQVPETGSQLHAWRAPGPRGPMGAGAHGLGALDDFFNSFF